LSDKSLLRTPTDFAKALALGANAVANSIIQFSGCLGMRVCQTNKSSVGFVAH